MSGKFVIPTKINRKKLSTNRSATTGNKDNLVIDNMRVSRNWTADIAVVVVAAAAAGVAAGVARQRGRTPGRRRGGGR